MIPMQHAAVAGISTAGHRLLLRWQLLHSYIAPGGCAWAVTETARAATATPAKHHALSHEDLMPAEPPAAAAVVLILLLIG